MLTTVSGIVQLLCSLKAVFCFLHIARREKSDPALNNADLLVIKVRCFSLCKLITVILSFQRRTSL